MGTAKFVMTEVHFDAMLAGKTLCDLKATKQIQVILGF